jgi:predicted O-methyltransferase YrrM
MHPLRKLWTGTLVQLSGWLNPAERDFARIYPRVNPIFGWLESPKQERWLFNTARSLSDTATLVEIGSYTGRSTACLGFGCLGSQRRIFALDLFDGSHLPGRPDYFSEFKANLRRCGLDSTITPVPGPSAITARTWHTPIDFLFIDGAHEYEGVVADIEGFLPHVVPGGLVALHDVSPRWPGVQRAWEEVARPRLRRHGHCGSIAFGVTPA